ncbi:hypothetical protein Zmor_011246 [Zophobas morio]|uniref:Uncharacterized protein n=1 Tax=Zophobas morio TaxID=2755281 RepID=A0AA38ITA3_9CUCU|nr:hypothetical protein Zmor_011246 [Zophobas morio]
MAFVTKRIFGGRKTESFSKSSRRGKCLVPVLWLWKWKSATVSTSEKKRTAITFFSHHRKIPKPLSTPRVPPPHWLTVPELPPPEPGGSRPEGSLRAGRNNRARRLILFVYFFNNKNPIIV